MLLHFHKELFLKVTNVVEICKRYILLFSKCRSYPQCLKITQKVAFDIASEASYVYILSRKKFIKNAKNGQFGMFWQTEATILTVLPDKPILIEQKSIESAKIRYSNATF